MNFSGSCFPVDTVPSFQGKSPSETIKNASNNPLWINVFQAYENLSDRVDLNSASESLIKPLILNNKFRINKEVFHFIE